MKWFKRLFGTRTKQESQVTSPTRTAEPAVTPAEATEAPADEPTEKSADEPVDKPVTEASAEATAEKSSESPAEPATEPEPAKAEVAKAEVVEPEPEAVVESDGKASDPAMNRLDDEKATADLAAADEPATEVAEVAVEKPAVEKPAAEKPAVDKPATAEKPAVEATKAEPAAAADEGPFGPGSAKPLADGAAPGDEYTVKGKRSSKLFHTAESPYFGRTKADVWFKTPADAENAGFAAWNHKKKAAAK